MNVTFTVAPITSESPIPSTIVYSPSGGTFLGVENNGHDIEYNYEWGNNRRPILVDHKHKTTTWTIKLLYTADNKKELEDLISTSISYMSYARNKVVYTEGDDTDTLIIKGVLKDVSTEYIGAQTAKVEYIIEGERVEPVTNWGSTGPFSTTKTFPGNVDVPVRLEIETSGTSVGIEIGDVTYSLTLDSASSCYIDGYSGKIATSSGTDISGGYTATRDGETVNELPHIKGGETVEITCIGATYVTFRTEGRWL